MVRQAIEDPALLNTVAFSRVDPRKFSDERNRTLWEALIKLATAQMRISVASLTDYLSAGGELEKAGGAQYLMDLVR